MKLSGRLEAKTFAFEMDLEESFEADANILSAVKQREPYEPDLTALFVRALRPGDFVVDVGANVGWFTCLAANLVGDTGHVLAFEPGPNNIAKLHRNVAMNGFKQVEISARPVSNIPEEWVTFHLNADGSGGHSLWDPGKFPTNFKSRAAPESVRMLTTTLDREIVGRPDTPRIVKIDTEGAELRVLEGLAGALSYAAVRQPPFIVAELHEFGLAELGASQADLRRFMRSKGYGTYLLMSDGGMPYFIPAKTVIRSDLIINLLFSNPAAIAEAWPEFRINTGRPLPTVALNGYGLAG